MRCQNPDCREKIKKGKEAYYHGKVYCQRCWKIMKEGVIISWEDKYGRIRISRRIENV